MKGREGEGAGSTVESERVSVIGKNICPCPIRTPECTIQNIFRRLELLRCRALGTIDLLRTRPRGRGGLQMLIYEVYLRYKSFCSNSDEILCGKEERGDKRPPKPA